MPAPLVPLVILALGAAGLGWAALAKRPGAAGGAAAQDLAIKVADQGPRGEWVFKPSEADSIVKSLSAQSYQYVDASSRDLVTIAPDPRGMPIAASLTAMQWARMMNSRLSILAPISMATSSPAKRFLRAVPSGQEQDFTGAETGYAVLLYAGTIDARIAPPGRPPGGGAIVPISPGGGGAVPSPGGIAPPLSLPPLPAPAQPLGQPSFPGVAPAGFDPLAGQDAIKRQLADLCLNGVNADALDAVANTAELFGFVAEAQCLRAKAAQLRGAQRPAPAPPPPPPVPGPGVQPARFQPPAPVPVPVAPPPPAPVVPPPTLTPNFATVTTQDAPPSGDLIIRRSPSMSGPTLTTGAMGVSGFAPGTPGAANQIGGAHKNGTVSVLSRISNEGIDWAEIQWSGDNRVSPSNWPAVRGFAKAQFLTPSAQAPVAPAPAAIPGGLFPGGLSPEGLLPANLVTSALPRMRVTTNDPAPSGDLFIVASPGRAGTPGVGAEKNGLVDVLNPLPVMGSDGNLWLNVRWNGGSRLGPVTGFAKAKFLVPVSPTTISGTGSHVVGGEGRAATIASSSGMRLRQRPGPHGETISLVPANTRVKLLKIAPGKKADARSPGPGGWALVEYEGRPGWVQAEWLLLA
jgi:hypothetical protein